MTETLATPDVGTDESAPTAHRLVVWAAATAAAADLLLMLIIGALIPPLLVFALLTIPAAVAARRRPRAGAVALALIAVLALGGGAPFLISDLANPTDPVAFVYGVLSGGGRTVALTAAVLALLERDRAARALRVGASFVLGLAVVGSITARAMLDAEERQAGDTEVVVADFSFPEEVNVATGATLLLDNRDPIRHTFTIGGTGTDVLLEPGISRRFDVDLPPGTYELTCDVPGHEAMTGTLEVR